MIRERSVFASRFEGFNSRAASNWLSAMSCDSGSKTLKKYVPTSVRYDDHRIAELESSVAQISAGVTWVTIAVPAAPAGPALPGFPFDARGNPFPAGPPAPPGPPCPP